MNKNSFWFIIWSHNVNNKINRERVRRNKKNFRVRANCLFVVPLSEGIIWDEQEREEFTSQVAPNKKTSSHLMRAGNVLKKYYNELVFFLLFNFFFSSDRFVHCTVTCNRVDGFLIRLILYLFWLQLDIHSHLFIYSLSNAVSIYLSRHFKAMCG